MSYSKSLATIFTVFVCAMALSIDAGAQSRGGSSRGGGGSHGGGGGSHRGPSGGGPAQSAGRPAPQGGGHATAAPRNGGGYHGSKGHAGYSKWRDSHYGYGRHPYFGQRPESYLRGRGRPALRR